MLAPRTPRAARAAMTISVAALVGALTALSVIDARHLHPARPLLLGLLAVVFVSTSAALVLFEQRLGSTGHRPDKPADPPPVPRRGTDPAPHKKV